MSEAIEIDVRERAAEAALAADKSYKSMVACEHLVSEAAELIEGITKRKWLFASSKLKLIEGFINPIKSAARKASTHSAESVAHIYSLKKDLEAQAEQKPNDTLSDKEIEALAMPLFDRLSAISFKCRKDISIDVDAPVIGDGCFAIQVLASGQGGNVAVKIDAYDDCAVINACGSNSDKAIVSEVLDIESVWSGDAVGIVKSIIFLST